MITTSLRSAAIPARQPKPLPANVVQTSRGRCIELFRGVYLRRTLTLAAIWATAYFVNYGIDSWLPTLYRSFFHLRVSTALGAGGSLATLFAIFGVGAVVVAIFATEAREKTLEEISR